MLISRFKTSLHFGVTLIATISLLLILWSIWQVINQPDLGILWTDQGVIYFAQSDSMFQTGDQIQTIDDVKIEESWFPYFLWQRGDQIYVGIDRNGQELDLIVDYEDQAPLPVLFTRLSLVLVVLAFWGVSTSVALFSSTSYRQGLIFFLFFQTLGVSLAIGNVTSTPIAAHLSLILTAFSVALAIHFHLLFPLNRITQTNKVWVYLAYFIAALSLLRFLIPLGFVDILSPFTVVYSTLFYLWTFIGIIAVLVLLFTSYRHAPSTAEKRQVGLVAICGVLAFTPLLTFSVFPLIFYGQAILPANLAFLFLIFIPVGYGYAVTKYQYIKLERYVSRSATAVLIFSFLCFFYFGVNTFLQTVLEDNILANPLVTVAIVMALVVVYTPLSNRLHGWVDSMAYGGWYDYPSVVDEVTYKLESNDDIETLVVTLSETVQKSMRVYWSCLFWQGRKNKHSIVSSDGHSEATFTGIDLGKLPTITAYMQAQLYPTTNKELCQSLLQYPLTSEEKGLLHNSSVRLWVPIRGVQETIGILILGPKYGGDLFDENDMKILDVVSKQASVAFQNVQLINDLQAKVSENEQYKKEIIRTREEERKRISRELHDQVIQALVGLKYQVAHLQKSLNPIQVHSENQQKVTELQTELGDLIQSTRLLCQDLRPAALDLGLIPSIRSLVSRFEMKSGTEVDLALEGDRNIPIGEEVALCLFRCTGEALSNIGKHSSAQQICVNLSIESQKVSLAVIDNGQGFHVPERLGSLMAQNHFGLVGLRERVELLNGDFSISSRPHEGTHVMIAIPLQNGKIKREIKHASV